MRTRQDTEQQSGHPGDTPDSKDEDRDPHCRPTVNDQIGDSDLHSGENQEDDRGSQCRLGERESGCTRSYPWSAEHETVDARDNHETRRAQPEASNVPPGATM